MNWRIEETNKWENKFAVQKCHAEKRWKWEIKSANCLLIVINKTKRLLLLFVFDYELDDDDKSASETIFCYRSFSLTKHRLAFNEWAFQSNPLAIQILPKCHIIVSNCIIALQWILNAYYSSFLLLFIELIFIYVLKVLFQPKLAKTENDTRWHRARTPARTCAF